MVFMVFTTYRHQSKVVRLNLCRSVSSVHLLQYSQSNYAVTSHSRFEPVSIRLYHRPDTCRVQVSQTQTFVPPLHSQVNFLSYDDIIPECDTVLFDRHLSKFRNSLLDRSSIIVEDP